MTTPTFDVHDAVEAIGRATAYDVPLRRRTEGVTWMVWGLATAVAFLVFSTLDPTRYVGWSPLFVLWPLLGIVGSSAAWRIAALSRASLAPQPSRMSGTLLIIMVGLLLALVTALAINGDEGPSPLLMASAVSALPWASFAALQWRRMTPGGQRIMAWTGVAMVIATLLVLGFLIVPDGDHFQENMLISLGLMGGLPFAVGLWRVFRG
jgi:hypothetical protein